MVSLYGGGIRAANCPATDCIYDERCRPESGRASCREQAVESALCYIYQKEEVVW
jgi:hypothetical protein